LYYVFVLYYAALSLFAGAELETETVGAQPEVEQGSPGESEQVNNKKRKPNFKPRGPNKCKRLANLKHGEKLELTYFHNGPVGPNHKDMTRHLGILVRDRTICPIRVRSWDEITENAKDHMWAAVLVILYSNYCLCVVLLFFKLKNILVIFFNNCMVFYL